MGQILSLEEANAQKLGQQNNKPGARLKSKKQLQSESLELYKAQQEEARLRAMRQWYEQSRRHVQSFYVDCGFAAHKDRDEKIASIVGNLLKMAAWFVVVADEESDLGEMAKTFGMMLEEERKNLERQKALRSNQMQAAIVAALIEDPELTVSSGTPALTECMAAPWLSATNLPGATVAEREAQAFGLLGGEKIQDQPAAIVLREEIKYMRDRSPGARLAGWKECVAALVKERSAADEKSVVETPVSSD